jgi:hypothetical protein
MSSTAEAELGALFINAKTAISIQQTLIELGHPQPRTPIQADNATAHALITNKILPKALMAMDMHFHWLQCRNAQGQFRYYWRPGTQNLADYFTKHHPATHHKSVRPTILTAVNDPEYRKLFHNTKDSTKLEGTNNYARNKNLRHKKLRAKQIFQKSPKNHQVGGDNKYPTRQKFAVLPKNCRVGGDKKYPPKQKFAISPKIAKLEGTTNTPPSKNLQYHQKIAELEGRNKFPKHDHSKKVPKNPTARVCYTYK